MLFNKHRNARRAREYRADFDLAHERARKSPVAMRALLLQGSGRDRNWAHPWLISDNDVFRSDFRTLSVELRSDRKIHHLLQAHYERVIELGVEALYRFADPDIVVTPDHLGQEMRSVFEGIKELDRLNDEAWARDAIALDTQSIVAGVLAHARSSAGELTA